MADRTISPLELLLLGAAPGNIAGLGHSYYAQALQQGGQPVQGGFVMLPGTQPAEASPARAGALERFLQEIIGGPRAAY